MSWADIVAEAPALPQMLGAELAPYPYLSGFGLLVRMAHVGLWSTGDLVALGLRNRSTMDVLLMTQRPDVVRTGLVKRLGLGGSRVADFWAAEVWSPLQTGGALDRIQAPVRFCQACASHGYHCALFQLPSMMACPWHRAPLQSRCPSCGDTSWARFHPGATLGTCPCGFDPFEPDTAVQGMWSFPTAVTEGWATDYLRWATARRKQRWLVVPEWPGWTAAYASLAEPPSRLQPRLEGASLETEICLGDREDPPDGAFWGWSLFGGDRLITHVPLPQPIAQRLQAIAPPAPMGDDATRCLGLDRFETDEAGPDQAETWLNLSVLDRDSAWYCGRLLDATALALCSDPIDAPRSLPAARSKAIDGLSGRGVLASALESMLCRLYGQSTRRIAGREQGRAEGLSADPWLMPVAEIRGRPGQLKSVRICWLPKRAPAMKREREWREPPNRGERRKPPRRRGTKKGIRRRE